MRVVPSAPSGLNHSARIPQSHLHVSRGSILAFEYIYRYYMRTVYVLKFVLQHQSRLSRLLIPDALNSRCKNLFIYLFFSRSKGYIWNEMFFQRCPVKYIFSNPLHTSFWENLFIRFIFEMFCGRFFIWCFSFLSFLPYFFLFGDEMLCIKGEGDWEKFNSPGLFMLSLARKIYSPNTSSQTEWKI